MCMGATSLVAIPIVVISIAGVAVVSDPNATRAFHLQFQTFIGCNAGSSQCQKQSQAKQICHLIEIFLFMQAMVAPSQTCNCKLNCLHLDYSTVSKKSDPRKSLRGIMNRMISDHPPLSSEASQGGRYGTSIHMEQGLQKRQGSYA